MEVVKTENGKEIPSFVARDGSADVCVVIVSYNTRDLLLRCLEHLRASCAGIKVRVVIVDNASRDNSVAAIKITNPDCIVVENTDNVGFGRANNQALSVADGEFVLLLNPDAFVEPDTLLKSLKHMEANPSCGILGVTLVDEAGQSNNPARRFPTLWGDFALRTGLHRPEPFVPWSGGESTFVDCDWVAGCYYLVRNSAINEVGLFDPRYFLYFEEIDHCLAAKRAGWKVQCLLSARVLHVGGASAQTDGALDQNSKQLTHFQMESEQLFFRKHRGLLGALAAAALNVLAAFIVACKSIVRRRHGRHAHRFLREAADTFKVVWKSSLGGRPTR